MSYGSSVPLVIDGLFTLLAARPGLAEASVLDEYPKSPSDFDSVVFLGRQGTAAVTGSAIYPTLNHLFVDESYTLWLTCQTLLDDSGGTQILARQGAYDLLGEVVGTLLTDPKLGFTETATHHTFDIGRGDGPYEIEDGGGWLGSEGHGWRVSIGLHCTCRIQIA